MEPQYPIVNLPEGARTPEQWEAIRSELAAERIKTEALLAGIQAERRGLALAATTGDAAAVKQNAKLNVRQMEVMHRMDLLDAASSMAAERLGEALEARERKATQVRRSEAVAVAQALLTQSKRADVAMVELAKALAARDALARRMTAFGTVSYRQLQNRTRLLAAAGYAGLANQMEVGRAPQRMHASLAEIDAKLLFETVGELPAEPAEAA